MNSPFGSGDSLQKVHFKLLFALHSLQSNNPAGRTFYVARLHMPYVKISNKGILLHARMAMISFAFIAHMIAPLRMAWIKHFQMSYYMLYLPRVSFPRIQLVPLFIPCHQEVLKAFMVR